MLRRVFAELDTGFYIDVGANDPSADSVTKAFYDAGWHGINIEPLRNHYADLCSARPRDINLQCAAGSAPGTLQIWETSVRGWATADPEVIAAYQQQGYEGSWRTVEVLTLSEICRQHVRGAIHFLKIDVEGFEKQVIEGADFLHYRPWVVLVEATRPNSTEPVYEDWESVLVTRDYACIYSDGINRYYLANEHADRARCFASPPNAFDDFVTSEEARYQAQAITLKNQLDAMRAQLETYQSEQQQLDAELSATQKKLEAMLSSSSWRITDPCAG
jgi:methyltransferase, FkbM family